MPVAGTKLTVLLTFYNDPDSGMRFAARAAVRVIAPERVEKRE